jgi:hypothetical protein
MNYDLLREKGYSGPESLYEVRAWIRKKYNLHLELFFSIYHKTWSVNNYIIDLKKGKRAPYTYTCKSFDNYEDALLFSLQLILTFIK